MLGCKSSLIPMEQNLRLNDFVTDNDPLLKDLVEYHKLVGKLIYLTISCPDISFFIHVLSQFMHKLKVSHLRAAFKVLRYLKGSPCKVICFKNDISLFLCAFCDSD